MIVVDASVLAYSIGAHHPLREPCRRLLGVVRYRLVEATTTVEVIQELVHVRGRRERRHDAANHAAPSPGSSRRSFVRGSRT